MDTIFSFNKLAPLRGSCQGYHGIDSQLEAGDVYLNVFCFPLQVGLQLHLTSEQ